jgi:indolepyruvate ferredoxin oxidoreductase beta subunit
MAKPFDIYMTGVGGQGIGLLAELLARAADHAGLTVRGSDTHGLAQRGGIVASHLRLGEGAHSPLVEVGKADLVVALERHEALRALRGMLSPTGVLVWYDAEWQPLEVRLRRAPPVAALEVLDEARSTGRTAYKVFSPDLEDPRAQNVVLVSAIASRGLIPGVGIAHCEAALADLLEGPTLEMNLALLRKK